MLLSVKAIRVRVRSLDSLVARDPDHFFAATAPLRHRIPALGAAATTAQSILGLNLREKKPHLGSYHNGWLDLAYHRDPGLEAGEFFPLWTIQ